MTDDIDNSERLLRKDPRQDRLKQALRENLKRRKQQVRERERMAGGAADDSAPPDAAADGSDA